MTTVDIRTAIAFVSTGSDPAAVVSAVDELERNGQPVIVVCVQRGRHDHGKTRADVLHVPLLSPGIVSSLILGSIRNPGRTLRALITGATLVRFPTAMYLAQVLPRRGITEFRAVEPAGVRLAGAVNRLSDPTPPDLTELPVQWAELPTSHAGFRWVSKRINSIAAEVSVDGAGDKRVIVKRQRSHRGGTAGDRWSHEHRTLTVLRDAMGDGRFTVPRILLFDEAAAMLVMERAPGTSLDAMFAAAASDRARIDRLADAIRGAGGWLAAMQVATGRDGDGAAVADQLVARAIADTRTLATNDRVIRRYAAEIVEAVRSLRSNLTGLTVAGHHDDYWPGNIFVDGERVTVIDFESFRDGLPLEDAAFFLIRSEMLQRRFRVPLPDLTRTFFEGYSPGMRADTGALRLFTLTKGLRSLANGMGEDLPLPQRLWTRRTIRGIVLRALQPSVASSASSAPLR